MASYGFMKENWRLSLVNLPRYPKRLLLVLNDFLVMTLSLWAGFSLRLNELYLPPDLPFALVLLAGPIIGLATFQSLGLYRLVTRFIGPQGATRIFLAVALSVLVWVLFIQLSGVKGLLPRSTIVMYGVLSAALVWASRQVAGWILRGVPHATPARFDQARKHVIIYGAGVTGVQLLQALRLSHDYSADRLHRREPEPLGPDGRRLEGLPAAEDRQAHPARGRAGGAARRARGAPARIGAPSSSSSSPIRSASARCPPSPISPPARSGSAICARSAPTICSAAIRCRPTPSSSSARSATRPCSSRAPAARSARS